MERYKFPRKCSYKQVRKIWWWFWSMLQICRSHVTATSKRGKIWGSRDWLFLWRTAVGILSVREWSATAPHTGDWVYWAGAAKRPEGRFRRLPQSDYRERGRVISLWTLESWINIEKVKMAFVGGDLKYRIFSIFYPFNSCSHCGCLNYNYCIVELSEIIIFLLLLCKRSHNEVFEGRF